MGTGSFVTTGFPSKPYFTKTLQAGVNNILELGIY
jgi:tryptophan synthase alpha subunit